MGNNIICKVQYALFASIIFLNLHYSTIWICLWKSSKSDLQRIGLNPTTAESWIRLIEYIQSQPRIKVTKMGSSTYIEKLENQYLSMLRRRILDSKLSLKERTASMNDYIAALISLERAEMGRIKK